MTELSSSSKLAQEILLAREADRRKSRQSSPKITSSELIIISMPRLSPSLQINKLGPVLSE